MPIENTLTEHIALCNDTYTLLLEENKLLKDTQKIPEAAFLERKKTILLRLEDSVQAIKELKLSTHPSIYNYAELIKTAQKKLMKISLLDSENEQLFLKYNVQEQVKLTSRPISTQRIQSLYQTEVSNQTDLQ